jgi:peptidylprolyl isomerase
MTKRSLLSSILPFMAAAALPLAAQTTPPASTTAPHRSTAATAPHRAAPGCVPTPELSPKIPALPASAPCAKVLYTVTRTPTMKLDYASPLVSAAARDELSGGSATYSLDYVETQVGTGEVAKAGKWLSVHYTGYLVDGTKFDSSHDHPGGQPISFPYGTHQVIQGWDTGFEGMHIGGKRRLFIPYELGYGDTGKGPIPAKAELIFDVELTSQSDTRPAAPPPTARPGAPGMSARPPGSGVHPPAGPGTTPPPSGTTPPPGTATPPQGTTPPPGTTTPPQGTTPPPGATTPPPAGTTPPQSGSSSDSMQR